MSSMGRTKKSRITSQTTINQFNKMMLMLCNEDGKINHLSFQTRHHYQYQI